MCFCLYLTLLIEKYYIFTRNSQDIFSPHKVFIESHRGVNREIFQNTIEAFRLAIRYKIECIETDVWLSKDNELVIMHGSGPDGNLEGFYDHPGNITNLTWAELSTYHTIKDNLTIPKLRDVMKLIKENKIYMNLEIKDPRVDLVFPYLIELIEEFDIFEQINLSSYEHNYYYKIREYNIKYNKNLIFGSLYKPYMDEYDYSRKGSSLNIFWANATKEICDKAHENGMAVLTYFGMDNLENNEIYKQLIQNGVDIICCNKPVLAKAYRDSYYIDNIINKIFFKLTTTIKKYIQYS